MHMKALLHRRYGIVSFFALAIFGLLGFAALHASAGSSPDHRAPQQGANPAPISETRVIPPVAGRVSTKQDEKKVVSGRSYKNDTSIPLRDMEPEPYIGKEMDREA